MADYNCYTTFSISYLVLYYFWSLLRKTKILSTFVDGIFIFYYSFFIIHFLLFNIHHSLKRIFVMNNEVAYDEE